jgi:hypothetical protein
MSETGFYRHHELLGYVPRPGYRGPGFGRSFHTIDADGLRSCGGKPASDEGAILTVGDSFTYGDEVRDEEAWPAQLQKLTGRRVLNGGVTGYGFDQIVLRAEELAAAHSPSVIVVSFIAHDLHRAEMRRTWWRDKPWFEIVDDRLVLKGVPVPKQTSRLPPNVRLRLDTALLGLPSFMQHVVGYHRRVHPPGYGVRIAGKLIERLSALQTDRGIRIVLMAQYPPDTWRLRRYQDEQRRWIKAVFESAASHGIATLDTFPRLAAESRPLEFYANGHMNRRGNLMVASLLKATLPALTK